MAFVPIQMARCVPDHQLTKFPCSGQFPGQQPVSHLACASSGHGPLLVLSLGLHVRGLGKEAREPTVPCGRPRTKLSMSLSQCAASQKALVDLVSRGVCWSREVVFD